MFYYEDLWTFKFKKFNTIISTNNYISKISGLDQLCNLVILHLGNNCIKHIENINLPFLTTLKLDNQKIPEGEFMTFDETCIKNLSDGLQTLTLSGNKIQYVNPLSFLKNLETLDLSNNMIYDWEDVKIMFKGLQNLINLNLQSNPVSAKGLKFRQKVVYACKKLEDGTIQSNSRKKEEESIIEATKLYD
ncbi:hypothetical protein H8356DRAFT_1362476, partial [Neocallimastix lanati (nom. inval.)]